MTVIMLAIFVQKYLSVASSNLGERKPFYTTAIEKSVTKHLNFTQL